MLLKDGGKDSKKLFKLMRNPMGIIPNVNLPYSTFEELRVNEKNDNDQD